MRDSEDDESFERPRDESGDGVSPAGRQPAEQMTADSRHGRERSLPGGGRLPDEETAEPNQTTHRLRVIDPVKERFDGEYDLYDLATWEVRSGLDRFAVSVASSLQTVRSRLLISTAFVLFITQIGLAGILVLQQPVLGILAGISVLPALFFALTLWYWDPTTREPFELVAVTFLLSMVFASFAAVVNTVLGPGFEVLGVVGIVLFYFLVVGPIEETVKWLAIRVQAYHADDFKTVLDGVVYGAVAGLGFAAIENFVYVVGASVEPVPGTSGGVEAAAFTAAARAFVGPGHIVFSAWAGFYLGLAKFNPENWGPIVVKGLVIAAFIHGLYNSLVSTVPLGAFAAMGIPPGLAFIAIVLGFHGFWFGLLYRKISRYRGFYESIDPARLRSRP